MIRLAAGAIVFCATLLTALVQLAPAVPDVREASGVATTAHAAPGCTTDEDSAWRPRHDETASITDSAWKWRTLHAELSAVARPGALAAFPLPVPPPACAPDAPSYLLHTPLLI